ncbi:MAG TPA: alcohol dehydrogenase catalytic domain-containing protein [Candidatus Limnocylindria bacterium]|nr:alcohol dehydrogenase catalytic domain-containing protein [Candidatus Limnocylindria bacterium]
MKAIVKFADGAEGFGMRDVARPVPARGELLLEVAYVGICGTDIHIIHDEYPHSLPVTLGHEYVATVAALGEGAEGFAVGDTVVSLACAFTCRTCAYCEAGLDMMCENRRSLGSWRDGAMSRFVVVPARSCFRVDGPPTDEKAAYEPAACCVRAVHEIGGVTAGDVVLVSGAGLIGQVCAQLCKQAGARVVIAGLPSDSERLALAESLGADRRADSAEAIAKALGDLGEPGFTLSFECAGAAASLANCIRFSKRHGRVVQVGLYGKGVQVDLDGALYKELRLLTSFGSNPSSWKMMLGLVGGIRLKPFLDRVLPLHAWEQAFRDAQGAKHFKVLMKIDG